MGAVVAQCRKCQGYTLLDAGPVKIVVDVAPCPQAAYTESVLAGETRYRVEMRSDGRRKLQPWPLGGSPPTFTSSGLQMPVEGFAVHREHRCHARHSQPLALAAAAPKAPASAPGHPVAPAEASGRSPAARATSHPSERPQDRAVRCGICRKLIDQTTEPFAGLFHERWIWASHEVCA